MDGSINALYQYFLTCPVMDGRKIHVDYLPEKGIAYTIDAVPADPVLTRYVDGSCTCRYIFNIGSVQEYGPDVWQNIANEGIFEKIYDWLERQTRLRNFPQMPAGCRALSIRAQSTGYLFGSSPDSARYQIQCQLTYTRKGER